MKDSNARLQLPKWPFYFGDLFLVSTAILIAFQSSGPLSTWQFFWCFLSVVSGAVLFVIPFIIEFKAQSSLNHIRFSQLSKDSIQRMEAYVLEIQEIRESLFKGYETQTRSFQTLESLLRHLDVRLLNILSSQKSLEVFADKLQQVEGPLSESINIYLQKSLDQADKRLEGHIHRLVEGQVSLKSNITESLSVTFTSKIEAVTQRIDTLQSFMENSIESLKAISKLQIPQSDPYPVQIQSLEKIPYEQKNVDSSEQLESLETLEQNPKNLESIHEFVHTKPESNQFEVENEPTNSTDTTVGNDFFDFLIPNIIESTPSETQKSPIFKEDVLIQQDFDLELPDIDLTTHTSASIDLKSSEVYTHLKSTHVEQTPDYDSAKPSIEESLLGHEDFLHPSCTTEPEADLNLNFLDLPETLSFEPYSATVPDHLPLDPIFVETQNSTLSSEGTASETCVYAHVMTGIGKKPYLRGEGAGLSWDIGTPMEFVETGKWYWKPSITESFVCRVYKNDEIASIEAPVQVIVGQVVDISPKFS